jgi:hypothetical protein
LAVTLEQLERRYSEKLKDLEDMKARGDLTRDWGEASLICVREALRDIRSVTSETKE